MPSQTSSTPPNDSSARAGLEVPITRGASERSLRSILAAPMHTRRRSGNGSGSNGSGGTPLTRPQALHQTQAAFHKFSDAMTAFAKAEAGCGSGDLTCVTKGALGAQKGFAAMADSLRAMSMPSAASRAANAKFIQDLHKGHTFFHSLSSATTATQYLDRTSAFPLPTYLSKLSKDYGHLIVAIETK